MTRPSLITTESVRELAIQVFEENFFKLAGDAAAIARARANSITSSAIEAISREVPEGLSKAADPAFLESLFQIQKGFAKSGDIELEAVLVRLLVALASAKNRSLREIAVSEAIELASKVTPAQLSIISLMFLTSNVRWELRYSIADFSKFVDEAIKPFSAEASLTAQDYSHLSSLGCIEIGGNPREFDVFLLTHFRSLFTRGIPRKELLQLEEGEKLLPLFEPVDGDPEKLRFAYQSNESIEEAALALQMPATWRATFHLDARNLLTLPERLTLAKSLNPAIEKLHEIWRESHSLFGRSSLTTTGIALAHANIASKNLYLGPLSTLR